MTTLNDYYEYTICEHFLSAMVNGDHSGLDDDEEQALKEFYAALPTDSGVWEFADESNIASCDIIGGHAVCVSAKLHFHNTNIVATPLKKWRCVVVERVYQTFEVEAADWDTAEQIAAGLFDATNRTDAEIDVVDTQEIEQ